MESTAERKRWTGPFAYRGYRAIYNPGGPGPEPFEGVRYAAPGPPDLEPITVALDDPMRVDRDH